VLAAAARRLATDSWRQWFQSFGTCSIAEPLESLSALGLDPASFSLFAPDSNAEAKISHTPEYERTHP
jgi:hypothetical protein